MLSALTRVFALLGNPVVHSLSPLLQNASIKRADIDATYVALRCDARDLPGLLHGLARAGGGGNVTIPHKGKAAATVEAPSGRVRATGACNTFWQWRGRIHGENTDVPAFGDALKQVIPDVRGAHVLIIGAGGAARAAVHSLFEDGCDAVAVLGRSRARARAIAAAAGRHAQRLAFTTNPASIRGEGFDLVVNATPLGLGPNDPLPLRFERLGGLTAVFDIVCKPGGTVWVNYAKSLGIPAIDGSEMLIRQAAAAFAIWFETDPPLDVMRAAFRTSARRASHGRQRK